MIASTADCIKAKVRYLYFSSQGDSHRIVKAGHKTMQFFGRAVFFASLLAVGDSSAEPNWLVRREVLPQRFTEARISGPLHSSGR